MALACSSVCAISVGPRVRKKKETLKTNGILVTLLAWSARMKRQHNDFQSEKKMPFVLVAI